ncbi:hypothetical protein SHIRM173S_12324 [Streptomyces hirsutus]
MTQDTQWALLGLIGDENGGVLVALKQDGRPQLSNVNHAYYPDERLIRVWLTDNRAKTRNLRRDPRASYHVTTSDRWAYTVAEGTAELSPVAADPHNGTVDSSGSIATSTVSTPTGTTTAPPWSATAASCCGCGWSGRTGFRRGEQS